jgi:hypothetical protein
LVTANPNTVPAGAPAKTKKEHNLGTLCVIDTEPRYHYWSKGAGAIGSKWFHYFKTKENNNELNRLEFSKFYQDCVRVWVCIANVDGRFRRIRPSI